MPSSGEKPPLKLLALDGGGIRGLSELLMLKEVMHRLRYEENAKRKDGEAPLRELPKPCDYFDLIGGTSTGGIIALMLGRLKMDVDAAINCYNDLAESVFSNRKLLGGEKFSAEALEEAIMSVVESVTGNPESALLEDDEAGICRTFVCAMNSDNMDAAIPQLFRTYHSRQTQLDCKIWQAARATSAAPTFFKPIEIGRGQIFIDGGLGRNNPSQEVLAEAKRLFGPDRAVGCFVSIGSGRREVIRLPKATLFQQILPTNVIDAVTAIATDCERTHEIMFGLFANLPNVYFRLNVDRGMEGIDLSEWEKLNSVEAQTAQYIKRGEVDGKLTSLVDAIRVPRAPVTIEQLTSPREAAVHWSLHDQTDHPTKEDLMIVPRTLVTVEQIDKNIEHFHKDLQKVQRVQVDAKIKEWLAPPDPSTDWKDAVDKRQDGTGDWFMQTQIFNSWRASEGNPVLWLHGQSGSGKTIISAVVIEKLLHDTDISDLAYFFFVVNSKVKESLDSMLSSFLLQLATGQERHQILSDAYNLVKHIGRPPRSSLLEYFKNMLAVHGNIVLVIDALDEHPVHRNELLRFLTDISCGAHVSRLRILVTSRDEPDIRAAMKDIRAFEFDLSKASEQKEDIRKYITSVLQSDPHFRSWANSKPAVIDDIKERLLQESMFRLVALQLDSLRRCASINVTKTLRTLPRSLMKMYDNILQSLDSENPETARYVIRVFEIISCASRPFTVDEVAEVFAAQYNEDNSVEILEEHRLTDPATELVQMCTSAFIRIEGKWVYFAHASVLDYLQRKHDTRLHSSFYIDPAEAAITLCKLCLCTIHSMVQSSRVGPFDTYARQYWLQETKRALCLSSVDKVKPLLDSVLLCGIESIPAPPRMHFYSQDPPFASPLCCASYLGQHDYVQQILCSSTSTIDNICSNGLTPLHYASRDGHLDVARVLVEHMASVDKEDSYGSTPLQFASESGHVDVLLVLTEHQASITKEDRHGRTPLHLASAKGHIDVVQILIKHQASVDKEDKRGRTPLHLASAEGHLDVVQILIKNQASVDKAYNDGSTPLHIASANGHIDIVQILIEQQAFVDEENNDGSTPLHLASAKGQLDVVQILIKHQASVDTEDKRGQTPLHLASAKGHLDVVKILIKYQASVNKACNDGSTPLHIASANGDIEAFVDHENYDGLTPLHLASANGHIDVVQFLIKHRASVDKKGGRTPLHLASDVGQILIKYKASVDKAYHIGSTPLHIASANGHIDIVQILIEHKAFVDEENNDGSTPLHLASANGYIDVVQILIKHQASVDKKDKRGRTPLYLAFAKGHLDVVQILIKYQAFVDKEYNDGSTPLHLASAIDHFDIMHTPTEQQAFVNGENYDSSTPLELASANGHIDVVQILQASIDKVDKENKHGRTADTNGGSTLPYPFDLIDISVQIVTDIEATFEVREARNSLWRMLGQEAIESALSERDAERSLSVRE